MKQIIIIAIVFTVLSCGNQKAHISEQIEVYKDSIRLVADSIKLLTDERMKEAEKNAPPDNLFDSAGAKWTPTYDIKREKERINKSFDLEIKRKYYKKIIDSLELELKKE
jgi:hypothetical protein